MPAVLPVFYISSSHQISDQIAPTLNQSHFTKVSSHDSGSENDQSHTILAVRQAFIPNSLWFTATKAQSARAMNSGEDWTKLYLQITSYFSVCYYFLLKLLKNLSTWIFYHLNPWNYLTQISPDIEETPGLLQFQVGRSEHPAFTVTTTFYHQSNGFLVGVAGLATIWALKVWAWPIFVRWWWPKKPRSPTKPKQKQDPQKIDVVGAGQQSAQAAK
jgi:hypothetical protein